MKILIASEEIQAVCKGMSRFGHEAYSFGGQMFFYDMER